MGIRKAILDGDVESIKRGTSFCYTRKPPLFPFQELGRSYKEPVLDAILANPHASKVVNFNELLDSAIKRREKGAAPLKVVERAPRIGRIFSLITTAVSFQNMSLAGALLKRSDDIHEEIAACQKEPPTCKQPQGDLMNLICKLGNGNDFSEQSILFEMIPKSLIKEVSPKEFQRRRYVNLAWKAQQIEAVWRFFRVLDLVPTDHEENEPTDPEKPIMHIVKGKERG